jgi:hypothetical protein
MMQQPVLFSPKFWIKSYFHAGTVVCRIDCLACQDELFVASPLDVKENDERTLDFALHISCLFSASLNLKFPCTTHTSFPENLFIIARVSITLFLRFAPNLKLFLCQIHHEITSGQIEGCKKSARPLSCMKFCILTPKTC